MQVSTDMIKELRAKTGAGVMESKKALEETGGDIGKAEEILKQRGLAMAEKKATRVASQGMIDAYLHAGGRIGAMVEVNCETDFVARTDEFKELAHDIAMQIAATNPKYVSEGELPEGSTEDPKEVCLLSQPFIKDPSKTIQQLVTEKIAKTGENMKVRRFARFELGAES